MTDSVRQPDLSVYLDFTTFPNEIIDTNIIIQIATDGPIYTSRDLTHQIGNMSTSNVLYKSTGIVLINSIYALPFGSVLCQFTSSPTLALNVKTGENTQFFNNTTIANTILSGSGDFIGSKGYVTVTTDDTSIRRVDFWLDKQ